MNGERLVRRRVAPLFDKLSSKVLLRRQGIVSCAAQAEILGCVLPSVGKGLTVVKL